MLAESLKVGKPVIFTRIAIGDGVLQTETIETLNALKSPIITGETVQMGAATDGQVDVTAVIDNSTITRGYYSRELGLFAKLGENGAEKLFAYANAGANASYVPPNTSVDEKIISITVGIGDATVKILPKSNAYISIGKLDSHNTDEHAHENIVQKLNTQLTTHNTDTSSHPAITAMIAKILGATNWQENPVATLKDIKNLVGMGGIVAQKFGENGYVKFANGFTIQWGVVTTTSTAGEARHVNLPIPMNNTNYVTIVNKTNRTGRAPTSPGGAYYNATFNMSTTGFDIQCDYTYYANFYFWVVIGG